MTRIKNACHRTLSARIAYLVICVGIDYVIEIKYFTLRYVFQAMLKMAKSRITGTFTV